MVSYHAVPFVFNISRTPSRSRATGGIYFTTSAEFEKQYNAYFDGYLQFSRRIREDEDYFTSRHNDRSWELRRDAARSLVEGLRGDYVESQLFVPAGRSFYTDL